MGLPSLSYPLLRVNWLRRRYFYLVTQHEDFITRIGNTITTLHKPFIPGQSVGLLVVAEDDHRMGKGVRAEQVFELGEIVTQYDGVIISNQEANAACKDDISSTSHFKTWRRGGSVIDGLRIPKKGFGVGSFIQHSFVKSECNVRWSDRDAGVFLVATRTIRTGEFLRVTYGSSFVRSKKCSFTPLLPLRKNCYFTPLSFQKDT